MSSNGLLRWRDYGGVLTDGPEPAGIVRRARTAGIATALVSGAHEVPAELAGLFDAVLLGATFGVRKPDPEAFPRGSGGRRRSASWWTITWPTSAGP